MTPLAETLVKSAALAELLAISTRRIQQLSKAGVLDRRPDGHYVLGPAIRAYVAMRSTEGLKDERTALVRARRQLQELELARQQGKVVATSEVHAALGTAGRGLVSSLGGCPMVIAGSVPPAYQAQVKAAADREILHAIRNYHTLMRRAGAVRETVAAAMKGEVLTAGQLLAAGIGTDVVEDREPEGDGGESVGFEQVDFIREEVRAGRLPKPPRDALALLVENVGYAGYNKNYLRWAMLEYVFRERHGGVLKVEGNNETTTALYQAGIDAGQRVPAGKRKGNGEVHA